MDEMNRTCARDEVERWWSRTAPTLGRERLASALLGRPAGPMALVRQRLWAAGLAPSSPAERRHLTRTLITGCPGAELPIATRIAIARTCAQAAWTDVTRCLREAGTRTDQEVDLLLAEAGASVAERLDVWGLGRR